MCPTKEKAFLLTVYRKDNISFSYKVNSVSESSNIMRELEGKSCDVQDHIKMVICPLMQAVTFIDQDGAVRTYKLIDLQRNGCSKVDLSFLQVTTTLFLQFSR